MINYKLQYVSGGLWGWWLSACLQFNLDIPSQSNMWCGSMKIHSLAHGAFGCNSYHMVLKHISGNDIWIISWGTTQMDAIGPHWWRSTLFQVMARCHQATSHNTSQRWPRSMIPYGIIKQQWLNQFVIYYLNNPSDNKIKKNRWNFTGYGLRWQLVLYEIYKIIITSSFHVISYHDNCQIVVIISNQELIISIL